jgi:hypothetical protein
MSIIADGFSDFIDKRQKYPLKRAQFRLRGM